MENETEKPEKQPLKEQAASAYRLKQAETLLKALGYLQIPNSKFWKKPDPEQEGKKFFLAGKQICPTDSKPHDFQIASSFLNESEIFEIQAQPQDTICRKCLGFLEDLMEDDAYE